MVGATSRRRGGIGRRDHSAKRWAPSSGGLHPPGVAPLQPRADPRANTFTAGDTNLGGLEVSWAAITAAIAGGGYRIANDVVTMVHRHSTHGWLTSTPAAPPTLVAGYLSHTYSSLLHDPQRRGQSAEQLHRHLSVPLGGPGPLGC